LLVELAGFSCLRAVLRFHCWPPQRLLWLAEIMQPNRVKISKK